MSQVILDDQLDPTRVLEPVQRWTTAQMLRTLRPGTLIKDDAVPMLLAQIKQPTFVTINVHDFWGRVPADGRYCIVCVDVPDERQDEVPDFLRRLFRLPDFKTKAARMGKVAHITSVGMRYYQVGDDTLHHLSWPPRRCR
jgi:hypothetical protein